MSPHKVSYKRLPDFGVFLYLWSNTHSNTGTQFPQRYTIFPEVHKALFMNCQCVLRHWMTQKSLQPARLTTCDLERRTPHFRSVSVQWHERLPANSVQPWSLQREGVPAGKGACPVTGRSLYKSRSLQWSFLLFSFGKQRVSGPGKSRCSQGGVVIALARHLLICKVLILYIHMICAVYHVWDISMAASNGGLHSVYGQSSLVY